MGDSMKKALNKMIKKLRSDIKYYINSFRQLSIWQKMIYIYIWVLIIIVFALLNKLWKWLPIILLVFLIYKFIRMLINNLWWRDIFNTNIFIFGTKGSGKDMLMQIGVYLNRRKQSYLSNLYYGYRSSVVDNLNDVFDLSNTYRNLVENKVNIIEKNEDIEGYNFVLSDASLYFPSQEDYLLNRHYPSFPLFYATSRQTYNMNFVVNTQVNGRLWKKLREQVQDGYVKALRTRGFGWLWNCIPFLRHYVVVNLRYYDNEESAVQGLLPFDKVAVINRVLDNVYLTAGGATKEQYEAQYGVIVERSVFMNKRNIVYDTRYFHKVFFGKEYVVEKGE